MFCKYYIPLILLSILLFVSLTGDFKTDVRQLQNCSVISTIKDHYKGRETEMTDYHKKLRATLEPWYKKNCRS